MEQYRGLGHTLNALMHKITLFAVISASITGGAYAGSPLWGQCGGSGWTGATTCDVGVCTYLNYCEVQPVFAGDDNHNHNHNANNAGQQDIQHQYECYLLHQSSHVYIHPDQSFDSEHANGKAALSGYSIGPIIRSGGTLYNQVSGPGCAYKYFLNVYNNANAPTSSYKDLKWENGVLVSDYWTSWGVTSTSPWGAHDWFLACQSSDPNYWPLYLQTGSDVPSGQNCTLTQLSQSP
ncbi:hypothetical protein FRC00_007262 [Tulasnella sp. 408]|nr:hypothetical protein FRC00_007262 [Tulasnella sp. 408]